TEGAIGYNVGLINKFWVIINIIKKMSFPLCYVKMLITCIKKRDLYNKTVMFKRDCYTILKVPDCGSKLIRLSGNKPLHPPFSINSHGFPNNVPVSFMINILSQS